MHLPACRTLHAGMKIAPTVAGSKIGGGWRCEIRDESAQDVWRVTVLYSVFLRSRVRTAQETGQAQIEQHCRNNKPGDQSDPEPLRPHWRADGNPEQ